MNFKNKWLVIAIAIVVLAIIIMIARQAGTPVDDAGTTTTTEEVVIDDTLPLEGDVIIDGDEVVDPIVEPIE